MALVVVPMGVKNAVDALTATVINSGSGDMPTVLAANKTIGAISTAVAELFINWLNVVVKINIPANKSVGFSFTM